MPVHIIAKGFSEGLTALPYGWTVAKLAPCLAVLYLLKWYFNGATNTSERNMHSKVVMMTASLKRAHKRSRELTFAIREALQALELK